MIELSQKMYREGKITNRREITNRWRPQQEERRVGDTSPSSKLG